MKTILLSVFAIGLSLSTPVFAQQRGTPAPSKPAPRTADGKADLSGVWQGGGLGFTLGSEATAATAGGRGVVAVYKPEAYAKVQEYIARRGIDDPMARCLMVGVPRITSMPMPFQIIQMPTQVIILYESFHVFRVIPTTEGSKHPADHDPGFMGDSIGHWDGDTLVVDVIGFNDKTWLGPVGSFHSDALHVTERYTRTTMDAISYEVTIEDPKVLVKPFTTRGNIRLLPGDRVREYECGENNEDVLRLEKLLDNESLFRRK